MDDTFQVRVRPKAVAAPRPAAEYMKGGRGVVMTGWRPQLREAYQEVASSWQDAAARMIDLLQNSGWIAGAIDQAVANTVGTGLRLKLMPENTMFGMSDADANAWARMVETRWELWSRSAYECDIEGRRTFGQMQAAVLRSWFAFGEIVAELPFRRRIGNRLGTKVRLIPPHRISRKTDLIQNLITGVFMDVDGFPVGYLAQKNDLGIGMTSTMEWPVPARDAFGRPRVVHVFDGAIGTVRGITPMVPALRVARQFDQLADATLSAAIIQTVFAASISANEPTEEVLTGLLTPQEMSKANAAGMSAYDAWFEAQAGWYERATIDVGVNGRVTHLFPGQKLEFHSPAHPQGNYREFSLHLLREIARCLGLTYESATGDYEGATYSSVRMASGEIFEVTKYRRRNIIAPFCQPAFEAWLEEEIETGGVPFPGGVAAFLANRAAVCRADWRGSPKPQADDVKTASAHEKWKRLGVISDEMIAQDLGVEIEDVYAQRARERELRKSYGLDDPLIDPVTGQEREPMADPAADPKEDPANA